MTCHGEVPLDCHTKVTFDFIGMSFISWLIVVMTIDLDFWFRLRLWRIVVRETFF